MRRFIRAGFIVMVGLFFVIGAVNSASALELGARAYYWFPSFKTDVRADDLGIPGNDINVKDMLGLSTKYFPSVEAFAGIGKHHLSLTYTPVDYSDSTLLASNVTFKGKTYTGGDTVETELKFAMLDLEYQYDLLDFENILAGFSIGLIGKVKYLDGKVRLNDTTASIDEKETFQVPVPMLGLGLHIGILADLLEARAKVTGIGYSGNSLIEAFADLSVTPFPFLDIHGGYKIIRVNVEHNDYYMDSEFSGPYVALTVGF
jgi:hypothetical protein